MIATQASVTSADPDAATRPRLSMLATAALLGSSVAGAIGFLGVGLVLPLMLQHFAATPGAGLLTQLLGGVVGASLAVGSPLIGSLIDRVGYRLVYMVGACFFALFGVAPVLLDNLYLILACRVGVGVAMAAVLLAGYAGIGALAPSVRAKMLGYNALIGGMSAVLLFPILGALGNIDWRDAFLPHLATLLLVPLGSALPPGQRSERPAEGARSRGLSVPVALLAVAMLGGMLGFLGPNFAAFYLASIGVTDPSQAAIPLAAGAFCSVLGSGLFGALHGRVGGTAVFAIALVLAGAGLLVSGVSGGLFWFAVGGGISGIGCAFVAPNLSVTAMTIAAAGRVGQAVGLTTGAMFAAQVVFPFLAEPLRQTAGPASVFLAFGMTALVVGVGYSIAALRARR